MCQFYLDNLFKHQRFHALTCLKPTIVMMVHVRAYIFDTSANVNLYVPYFYQYVLYRYLFEANQYENGITIDVHICYWYQYEPICTFLSSVSTIKILFKTYQYDNGTDISVLIWYWYEYVPYPSNQHMVPIGTIRKFDIGTNMYQGTWVVLCTGFKRNQPVS